MKTTLALVSLSVTMVMSWATALQAQQGLWLGPEMPMAPQLDRGQPVSPFFEGWYENPDGTYTLSFGYYNRNLEETLEIPIGPDNSIAPREYDGHQPTTFFPHADYGIKGREWGVFAVVVPGDFVGSGKDVVWTLRSKGATHSVPGRVGNPAYQLQAIDQPMGRGSMPPRIRFDPAGPEGIGHEGITGRPLSTSVGVPVTLTVWGEDNFEPEMRNPGRLSFTWFKHQGPPGSAVAFSQNVVRVEPGTGGEGSTTATFSEPGDYVLRVRVDGPDSSAQRLCCWTNGYVRVTVLP